MDADGRVGGIARFCRHIGGRGEVMQRSVPCDFLDVHRVHTD